MGISGPLPFVLRLTALLFALLLATSASAQTTDGREAVLASLERAIAGEVLHTDYGEGNRLQREVNDAFKRGDTNIVRLAQRAARPILAYAYTPVGMVQEPAEISIESLPLLKLPRAVTYSAEIFYSLDGGPLTHGGTLHGNGRRVAFLKIPAPTREPGFHHLRFRADITYGGAGADLPQEVRRLADVTYALYDETRPDVAHFALGPSTMTAQQLDSHLPRIPFAEWIRRLARTPEEQTHEILWNSIRCGRGTRDLERPAPPFGDVCVTANLPFGRAWFRTGRIERSGDGARWIALKPEVLAVQVAAGARATEVYSLSELPALLATDPGNWPAPDVFLVPNDIVVTRTGTDGAATLDITVTIRNQGRVDARDVQVTMITTNSYEIYMFHLDVERRGATTFRWSEAMPASYGAVLVAAEVVLSVFRHPTETREPAKAFRIVNPPLAPPGYLKWVREKHATSNGY